jgi:hypothetical protein
LKGETTRAIAAEVGCEQGDVARRRKRLSHLLPRDLPPCACGKPKGHGSRCILVVAPALVRARLLAGMTTTDIAREFNRAPPGFRARYVQPVIDQLTSEGLRCGCGEPYGHPFVCSWTCRTKRISFTVEQRDQARALVRQGASVERVRSELSITRNSARILTDEIRADLAGQGVACPCGRLINHSLSCSARNADHTTKRTAFRFKSAAALSMSSATRQKISGMARSGWPTSEIIKRTDETEWRVAQLVDELGAAGRLPASCRSCDQPYRHRGPCPKPKLCKCGRPRKHRGACRPSDGRKRIVHNTLTKEKIAAISRATEVSFSSVQRVVARWRKQAARGEQSKRALRPCACGRPAFHPGGCVINTPGAVGKRWLTRIEQGVMSGRSMREIADDLDMHVQTVAKHSLPARERLFATGTTCACGRIIGHNYWCSATWDLYGMPRGRRKLRPEIERGAIDALLRGDAVRDIAISAGVGKDSIWLLLRSLPDSDRAKRSRVIRERISVRTSASADILERIKRLVPHSLILELPSEQGGDPDIDASLYDEVVAELYLAVLEGRLEMDRLPAVVRSFVSRGFSEWRSRYGPKSLDQRHGEGRGRALVDMIEDDTALHSIDDLTIGGQHG